MITTSNQAYTKSYQIGAPVSFPDRKEIVLYRQAVWIVIKENIAKPIWK